MAQVVAHRLHCLGDGAQALALRLQPLHHNDGLLFALTRYQVATDRGPSEGPSAAEEAPLRLLLSLHLAYALADAVTLCLSEGSGNGQEELAQPVRCDVAA